MALVETDVKPPVYASGEIVGFHGMREHLRALLDGWGRHAGIVNAEMMQEAEAAGEQVDRWHGRDMRLCGYCDRIDVYQVAPGTPATEQQWQAHAADYDRRGRERRIALALDGMGVPADEPYRPGLAAWLRKGDVRLRESDLEKFAAMWDLPGLREAVPAGRTKWQWVTRAAMSGDSPALYKQELVKELQARAGRGSEGRLCGLHGTAAWTWLPRGLRPRSGGSSGGSRHRCPSAARRTGAPP